MNGELKFLGQFEKLYRKEKDPWCQGDFDYNRHRRRLLLDHLRELSPASVLDIGCGLGYTTYLMKSLITTDVLGIDISKTSIKKAKKLFPSVDFEVCDIRNDNPVRLFSTIILNHILWYILPDLESVFAVCWAMLEDDGFLVISHEFIENQRYGKDIIDGFTGLLKYITTYQDKKFKIEKTYYDTEREGIIVMRRIGGQTTAP